MKKIKEIFEDVINEELLSAKFNGKIDIYRNPKSISRFPVGARGVLTESGELFIVDDNGYNIIHSDLIEFLKRHMLISHNLNYTNGLSPFRKNTEGNVLTLINQTIMDSEDPKFIKTARIGIENFRNNNTSTIKFKLHMFDVAI